MNTTTLPTQRPDSLTASMADAHDTRAAKRQQVVPLENETPWRQTITSTAAPPRVSMDARSSFANRRRSGLRDYKPPLGPRPPDFANNKRVSSDIVNPPPQPTSRRSLLPNAASEPFLGLSSRRKTANLESLNNPSSNQARLAASQDITPSPGRTPTISDHVPAGEADSKMGSSNVPQESEYAQTGVKTPSADPNSSLQNNSAPRASPAKPRNPAVRAAQLSTASASGPSVSTPLTIRTKRQSQIPPSVALDPHQPRKSVGPGLPVQASKEKVVPEPSHRFPQPASVNGRSPDFTWNFTNVKAKPRASMGPSMMMGLQNDSAIESKRNLKARSFHPGLHPPQGVLPGLPGDVSSDELEKTTARQSQNRPQARRPNGTLSATKRQAALGLARTVSPTDAMKLKRSSVVEKPPPIPARSSTPESSSAMRSGRRSPTPPRQKSATPSSFHTPEVGHGQTAGRSLSSRSSFNSSHPLSSSLQQGSGYGVQAYKSSTIRPKSSDVAATEDLEAVPPVPAIPKAFESPNHTVDEPFFESFETLSPSSRSSQNKKVTNVEATQLLGTKTDVAAVEPQQPSISDYSAFPMAKEPRSRRRFTLGAKTEQNKSSASTQQSNRQTLQQMRLPPLNLLPLSNPTSEKIASLANAQSQASSNGHTTPPSRRQTTKTPTTPMTASRATFSTFNMLGADDPLSLPPLRINNVGRDIMTEPSAQEESSGSSPTTFLSTSPSGTPPAVSPIPSVPVIPSRANDSALDSQDELPKRREPGDNRASRLISLRTRTFSRSGKESNTSQSTNAQQADTTNTALPNRRKLSLGWRRSSSKASHSHPQDERLDSSIEKHQEMPPPKLPPPTAWNESFSPNSSVGSSKPREIASSEPRKVSNPSLVMQEPKRPDLAQSRDLNSSNQDAGQSEQAPAMPEKAANFLTPMHKLLNSRNAASPGSNMHGEQEMSRDDLAAEEEMKRLAAKKKEFEAAAKEVDQLRRKASPKDRLSPGQASRAASLNIFERGEIIDYPDIYFCGLKDARKCIGDLTSQGSNFGYDDERGDYNIVMGDHLSYRYEVVDILGKGSFGQVVRCIDHKTGKLVAVKIIRNKKRFHQQALVEVNILQRLRDWDPQSKYSNVEFTQSFYFRGHLCIATELLGMNLYEFVKAHDFRGFSLKLIRRFTRQMLNSLSLLQNNKVIHCDLKPENILLAHPLHSEIKVIDFGSSCFENEKVYTYIQSRFYRSPEVILGMDYGMPIDMWSVGCILAELYTGYPIFPGENEQEQLACIMEVFGPPEKHLIERSSRKKLFFDSLGKPRMTVSSKGKRRRPSSKTLQQAIKCDDEAFLDFLTQCLRWDPERRLKPDRALAHDFVTGLKSRSRTAMSSGTSSPVKRLIPTTQTPGKPTRPLPDPPATSYKNGIAMNSRGPSSSPLKSTIPPRRHSTIAGLQAGAGVKRSSNGSALAPALPRSVSGKPDMASAAAIASLRQR